MTMDACGLISCLVPTREFGQGIFASNGILYVPVYVQDGEVVPEKGGGAYDTCTPLQYCCPSTQDNHQKKRLAAVVVSWLLKDQG